MPIVDSWIEPGTSVHEYHRDHLDRVQRKVYRAKEGDDINALMLARVPSLNTNLAVEEINEAIEAVRAGADAKTLTFVDQTNLRGRRRVVKAMLSGPPEDVMRLAEVLSGLTDTQLTNLLNISGAKLTRIKAMLAKAAAIKSDFEAVRDDGDRV